MKILYLVTAGLQLMGALLMFPQQPGIGALNLLAAAASLTLWILALRRETAKEASSDTRD